MKKISIAITCFLGVACSTAFAENKAAKEERSGYYIDASYMLLTVKDTSSSDMGTWRPTLARITAGKEVTENLAIEGFITQGINSDTVTYNSNDIKIKTDFSYGIAVRPFMKATDDLEIYGRVGWMQNKGNSSIAAASYSEDFKWNQYFWSLGVAYKITANLSAIIDYSKLQQIEDTDESYTAIGVRYNF